LGRIRSIISFIEKIVDDDGAVRVSFGTEVKVLMVDPSVLSRVVRIRAGASRHAFLAGRENLSRQINIFLPAISFSCPRAQTMTTMAAARGRSYYYATTSYQ